MAEMAEIMHKVVQVVHEHTTDSEHTQDAMAVCYRAVKIHNAFVRAMTSALWFVDSDGQRITGDKRSCHK